MDTVPFEPRRFRSTVEFYTRYRVPYPASLIAAVAARAGLCRGDRVLDLGTGPGVLALAFAQLGLDVTGIDPEPEMLAAARGAAAEAELPIAFRAGSSYDLGPDLGRFRLVTMGRSFHWMDRPATLLALDGLIEPGGAVALFADRRLATEPEWQRPLYELGEKYSPGRSVGRQMRAGQGWAPHEAVLLKSPFSAVESLGRVLGRELSADDIVGRAYSMSASSPEALGERREEFEAELRTALAALSPEGHFAEVVAAEAILAFRPAEVPQAARSACAGPLPQPHREPIFAADVVSEQELPYISGRLEDDFMSGNLKSPAKDAQIKSVDPVWDAIVADARTIVADEPALASLVVSTILNHDRFETALAHRLAERLDHSDLSADLIRQAFHDALEFRPEIGAEARADLAATMERDPACHRAIEPLLYFKGYQAIQTHRFAHALNQLGRRDFALYLQSRASQVFQVDINPAARIGRGIMLDHGTGTVIGETAVVGDHVSLMQGVTLGGTGKSDQDRHPKIGNGVLIGAGAIVLGNIRVGDCARVAAGSVVVKEVPPRVTVAGVPARIVGEAGCAQPASVMDHIVMVHDTTG